jgi:hypothetical protein
VVHLEVMILSTTAGNIRSIETLSPRCADRTPTQTGPRTHALKPTGMSGFPVLIALRARTYPLRTGGNSVPAVADGNDPSDSTARDDCRRRFTLPVLRCATRRGVLVDQGEGA